MIEPGNIVMLNEPFKSTVTLWKSQLSGTESVGDITKHDVALVVARVATRSFDQVLLLVNDRLGWAAAHWFEDVCDV